MPEHFVLDTGPLIEFFVRRYEHETAEKWFRGVDIRSIRTQLERELMGECRRRQIPVRSVERVLEEMLDRQ